MLRRHPNQDIPVDIFNDLMEIESNNSDNSHREAINVSPPIIIIKQSISNNDTNDDEENDQDNHNGFDSVEIPDESQYSCEGFHWIVLWILLYQERYKLSDVATDSLVKFLRYLLVFLDSTMYNSFPTSLYIACKKLGICAHIIKYASCEKCYKLYNVSEVSTDDPRQVLATDYRQNLPFFWKDVLDHHLGIMLNIDWFQPFNNASYSIGALYALISRPNEPSLHQLNHYIAPIIDQLIELWDGIELSKMYESFNRKSI
ncbi:hypothetical protein GLOIN_2v1792112 [Rhizophagus clarus]|uniref:Uncharacterized protein n=1 Tax=Rhizophagus clarus TaxID=94130 RepID=A0A8H3KTY2_9GLOM|nr:hypothetical protein GLOIN_2v1792112 [Rhizophagus clarus]